MFAAVPRALADTHFTGCLCLLLTLWTLFFPAMLYIGLRALAGALDAHHLVRNMQLVLTARVPIIKFEMIDSGLAFDVSWEVGCDGGCGRGCGIDEGGGVLAACMPNVKGSPALNVLYEGSG